MPNPQKSAATPIGSDNIPASGALLIPSRLDIGDLHLLGKFLHGRQISYLLEQNAQISSALQELLEREDTTTEVFSESTTSADELGKTLAEHIARDEIVIFVPSESDTLPAPVTTVPSHILKLLLATGSPVLPAHVEHHSDLALTIFPISSKAPAQIAFGPIIDSGTATLPAYQQSLLALAEQTFSAHPIFSQSLGYSVIQGLKKHGGSAKIIDGLDGTELPFDRLLAAATVLAKEIRKRTQKSRVAIILPPGKGGLLANVAALLSGKTPVNLNFTAAKESVGSSIKQADLDLYLTADPFVRKMQAFPWPDSRQMLLLERELPKLKGKIVRTLLLQKILPASLIASFLGVPKNGGREEAVLLFTSGSSGEPKGVPLSHRNVLANVTQFGGRLSLDSDDRVLGCLPLFHSFGCTVTMWYPMIEGLTIVTYPSPLEAPKLAELIEKHRVSLLLATPTFLRGYLRRVKPEQLAPVKLTVTGAEKLPKKIAQLFEKKFGKPVYEGYGLTETSPATNVNLPDPTPRKGQSDKTTPVIPAHRQGSVGQMLPGVAARITDPNTGDPLPINESGMLWLKGSNIFEGYLNDKKRTDEVVDSDRWFQTGDIARLDEDGFLYIEGRLSRFSKIGGEMVPHEVVEEHINRALGLDSDSERKIAVVGVPDEAKGEALVLLSTVAGETISQEIVELRHLLLDQGVPSLWIPKKIARTPTIPLLASGKLDIKGCETMAAQQH